MSNQFVVNMSANASTTGAMTDTSTAMTTGSIVTAILAGGHSRRMGEDKALMLWDGEPMLQRVYAVARSLTPRSLLLSAWNDRYCALDLPDCEFLADAQPGAGPLIALTQVMQHVVHSLPTTVSVSPTSTSPIAALPAEWILLLACDLPCLDRAHLAQLCDRVTHCDQRTLAIVPRSGQIWEPLCALYRCTALAKLREFSQLGGRSFQRWFEQLAAEEGQLETVTIAPNDQAWLRNCNTPTDMESR